jgi:hypothetical protein
MRNAPFQVKELARMQDMRLASSFEIDGSLDALHRDFSDDAVLGHRLPGRKDEAKNLQVFGLEDHGRFLVSNSGTERCHVDHLTWKSVRRCHARTYHRRALPAIAASGTVWCNSRVDSAEERFRSAV